MKTYIENMWEINALKTLFPKRLATLATVFSYNFQSLPLSDNVLAFIASYLTTWCVKQEAKKSKSSGSCCGCYHDPGQRENRRRCFYPCPAEAALRTQCSYTTALSKLYGICEKLQKCCLLCM